MTGSITAYVLHAKNNGNGMDDIIIVGASEGIVKAIYKEELEEIVATMNEDRNDVEPLEIEDIEDNYEVEIRDMLFHEGVA